MFVCFFQTKCQYTATTAVIQLVRPTLISPDLAAIRLVCVSDTHDQQRYMPEIPNADILVHAGDFTNIGCREEIMNFIEWTDNLLQTDKVYDSYAV